MFISYPAGFDLSGAITLFCVFFGCFRRNPVVLCRSNHTNEGSCFRLPSKNAPQRNQSIEFCKFAAALIVVLLHITFPGKASDVIATIGKVPVPLFFTISGYFNWQCGRDEVLRKIRKLLRLWLLAWVFAVAVGVAATELNGGSTAAYLKTYLRLDAEEIARLLVLHQEPRNAQLWYLLSLVFCDLFLVLYLDFRRETVPDYRPLYTLGACQFAVFWLFGCIAAPAGMSVPYLVFFNGYCFGFSFFVFGIFLHEYQQQILRNLRLTPKKLLLLFAGGVGLSLLQSFTIGSGLLPLGGILEIPALMLLMIACPLSPRTGLSRWFLRRCGRWSAYIYVFHVTLIGFYRKVLQAPLIARLGEPEAWLAPLICLALSIAAAALYDSASRLLRSMRSVSKDSV